MGASEHRVLRDRQSDRRGYRVLRSYSMAAQTRDGGKLPDARDRLVSLARSKD